MTEELPETIWVWKPEILYGEFTASSKNHGNPAVKYTRADLCAHDKPLPEKVAAAVKEIDFQIGLMKPYSEGQTYHSLGCSTAIHWKILRAALTNAKPVDNTPLRDDAVKAVTEMYAALGDSDKWHKHFGMVKAALQPTVINKHEELAQDSPQE